MIDLQEANLAIVQTPVPAGAAAGRRRSFAVAAAVLIALAGIALRLWMPVGFRGIGFDEALYRIYVLDLDVVGFGDYDTISQKYLLDQRRSDSICKLPPTRFLYIYMGWLWKKAEFGPAPPLDIRQSANVALDPATVSLRHVSQLFSVLLFLLSGVAAWRMFERTAALAVFAFMAAAPLQLHMGGHALIDGFFAFWAMLVLWTLWENLRHPGHAVWLTAYGVALALLVATKENAFFVVAAVAALLFINRWAKFGTVTPRLLLVSLLGPVFGLALLVKLAGGLSSFVEIYQLLVKKAEHLDYAILTGDGPWHRYLIDEIIVSPFVVCLAIGGMCGLARKERSLLFFGGFIVFTYAVMCQVRYGMNLRYGTIWDFPLCAIAAAQLVDISKSFGRWRSIGLCASVAAICGYEIWQYWIFFVAGQLYEIPTESLLRAVDVLKS